MATVHSPLAIPMNKQQTSDFLAAVTESLNGGDMGPLNRLCAMVPPSERGEALRLASSQPNQGGEATTLRLLADGIEGISVSTLAAVLSNSAIRNLVSVVKLLIKQQALHEPDDALAEAMLNSRPAVVALLAPQTDRMKAIDSLLDNAEDSYSFSDEAAIGCIDQLAPYLTSAELKACLVRHGEYLLPMIDQRQQAIHRAEQTPGLDTAAPTRPRSRP